MKTLLRATLAVALAALLITAYTVGATAVANATVLTENIADSSQWGSIQGLDRLNTDISGGWGYMIGSSFSTGIGGTTSYTLTSVTLNAFQETLNPNYYSPDYQKVAIPAATVQMYLYSNTGGVPGAHANPGVPGTLIGTLASPFSFTSAPNQDYMSNPNAFSALATFTTSGIPLAASSYYWIVLKPLTGSLVWDEDSAPQGIGAQAAWAINGYPTASADNPPIFTPHPGWNSAYDPSLGGVAPDVYGDQAPFYMMQVDAIPLPPTLLLLGSGLLTLVGLRRRKKV